VDAECMTTILRNDGYQVTTDMDKADVAIINTCGFIESAKTEAIDTILSVASMKKPHGHISYIVVTGCLSQRYPDEIRKSLPEVDAVVGTGHYHQISEIIQSLFSMNKNRDWNAYVSRPGSLSHMRIDRMVSTRPYAWLKIAEGCSNGCAFCAIPMIRGKYISRPMEEIIEEAKSLAKQGFHEIILAAQDTTSYGKDLYRKHMLSTLLSQLGAIEGIHGIRIMYAYIDGVNDELIHEIKTNPKVLHYLDIPVQHGDDEILKKMHRRDTVESITNTLQKLRDEIPDIVIRSTVMVGFPGEKKSNFDNLIKNIKLWKFNCLGCFIYSPEENTLGFSMKPRVRSDVAQRRYDKVMTLQQDISLNANQELLGKIVNVTIDSVSDDGIFYLGRTYRDAPEIDSTVYVAATREPLSVGDEVLVKIVDCSPYDLTGVTE